MHLAPYSQGPGGYYSNVDGSGPYAKDGAGRFRLMAPSDNGGGGGGGSTTDAALLGGRLFYYEERVVTDDTTHVYKLAVPTPVVLRVLATEIDQGGMETQLVQGATFPTAGTPLATHNANFTSSATTGVTISGFAGGTDATSGVVIGTSMARAQNGGASARTAINAGTPLVLSPGEYCIRLIKHQASSYIGLTVVWETIG